MTSFIKKIFLGAILLGLVAPLSAQAIPIREGNGHIKYYGFYGQAYPTNYLVAGSANVSLAYTHELEDIGRNRETGIASILVVQDIFFADDAGRHVPLRSDSQLRWESLARQIEHYALNGSIIGVYLYGEPYSNRAALGLPKQQTYNELQTAAKIVKNSFPWLKVMVVEQADSSNPSIVGPLGRMVLFPPEIDWVGFDCYLDTFETCGGNGIPFYFNRIKSGLHSNQKIFLVPQIFAYTDNPTVADQNNVINLNKKYVNLAQSSPEVIGVMGWLAANYKEPNNPVQFWGGLESDWGSLDNSRVRDSLLENGRILLGWQAGSRQADEARVNDKNRIISALKSYYRARGSWPQSTSGAWSCLASSSEVCWNGAYRGSDNLVSELSSYISPLPRANAVSGKYSANYPYAEVAGNYGHDSYLYASDLPVNNLGNGNPRGAYLIWMQENGINNHNCAAVAHPDKYWYCYEFIEAPSVTPPPTPVPPSPVPPPPPGPGPSGDLKVNGSDGPITISANTAATLSWNSSNATMCYALGDWSGTPGLSGSKSTGVLTSPGLYYYILRCQVPGESHDDHVYVNVLPVTTPAPVPAPKPVPAPNIPPTPIPTPSPVPPPKNNPPISPNPTRPRSGGGGRTPAPTAPSTPGKTQTVDQISLRVVAVNVKLSNFIKNKPVGVEYQRQIDEIYKEVLEIQLEVMKLIQSGVR